MIHGSETNTSERPRRFLLFALAAADAWPLRGVPDIAAWDAKLLRGEPTLHPRVEANPVRIPLPGIVKGGSIYENQSVVPNARFKREEMIEVIARVKEWQAEFEEVTGAADRLVEDCEHFQIDPPQLVGLEDV